MIPLLYFGAELALPTLSALALSVLDGIVIGAITAVVVYEVTDSVMEAINEYSLTKSGSVDPSLPVDPEDLLKRPGWKETTHPEAGKHGRKTFEHTETGEKLEYDKGKPGEPGHKGHDHYHRPNPNTSQGRHDQYLDGKGNPVRDHSDASHIYHPDNVWWE